MKTIFKTILLLSLIISVVACNTKTENKETKRELKQKKRKEAENKEKQKVCDLINQDFIKTLYPEATGFKYRAKKAVHPSCNCSFTVNGKPLIIDLTVAFDYKNKDGFEKSMLRISGSERVNGISDIAFYVPKAKQLSAWQANKLIYLNVNHDKNKTFEAAKMLLKKLK